MCKPLPIAHVMSEPWFQALRTMKQDPAAQLYGVAWPCRTLAQASVDVFTARQRATARALNLRANNRPLDIAI
jgi:hypothetical protein